MAPSRRAPLRCSALLGCAVLLGAACEARSAAPSCPPCECACDDGANQAKAGEGAAATATGEGAPTPSASPQARSEALLLMQRVGELTASASRKMFHDDGAGCLADLDALAKLDPALGERQAVTRGQCEMLTGRCQAGKARISAWYQREVAMTKARADESAEQLAAIRCRGGDESDRDRLLGALHELTDAAYINPRDPAYCEARLVQARKLFAKVPPRDANDHQISGGRQALFHTAAACFVKAGDCSRAYATYSDLFPRGGLDALPDPQLREKAVRDAFDASFDSCKASKRAQ